MLKQNVQLRNCRGLHKCWVSLPEARTLESRGQARRIAKHGRRVIYQEFRVVEPSKSQDSAASLTDDDLERNAGADGERGQRIASRIKVQNWPFVWDRRSMGLEGNSLGI